MFLRINGRLRGGFKGRQRMAALVARDGLTCFYCEQVVFEDVAPDRVDRATVDHLVPFSRGGQNRLTNCVIACFKCNNDKGSLNAMEFFEARGAYKGRGLKQHIRVLMHKKASAQ